MCIRSGIVVLTVLLLARDLAGQSDTSGPLRYPGGITVGYGAGSFALRDEYISPERYSGTLPFYAVGWTRSHQHYVYMLDFEFRQSDAFKNNNVTSDVMAFRLGQGFLYPLKSLNLFRKELGFWIGPTTDFAYFENHPEIAVSGFDYTNSFATLISLGFRSDAVYPAGIKWALETSIRFTLLTVGMRTVDEEEDESAGTKILTPASGLNASYNLGIRYNLFNWLSLGGYYRFDLLRVTAWENLLSAGNSAVLMLHFNF